jgi:hypothetical protein
MWIALYTPAWRAWGAKTALESSFLRDHLRAKPSNRLCRRNRPRACPATSRQSASVIKAAANKALLYPEHVRQYPVFGKMTVMADSAAMAREEIESA